MSLNSTPQEPKKSSFQLKSWHYAMVLMSLYFIWGEFFPEPTFINQVIFNFALFYPVGFMNGYFEDTGGTLPVFRMAILFNLMTYVLVILAGISIPLLLAGTDFLTLFLFLYWEFSWVNVQGLGNRNCIGVILYNFCAF